MPHVIGFAVEEFMSSANMAFAMYPGLTNGAVNALLVKDRLSRRPGSLSPRMVANEWLGTMNLTEPQCGTDLDPHPEPQLDGSYAITGTKIFISAGEHDLTDNIIHLVLAKPRTPLKAPRASSPFV